MSAVTVFGAIVDPVDSEQREIERASMSGNMFREMGLRSARVARLLPDGLFLKRGTGRRLVEDLAKLREFSQLAGDRRRYAHDTMHLAFVVFRLDRGDIAKNQDRAIKYIQEAIATYSEETDPDEWAQAHTFAATFYNERERGDKSDNFKMAEEHCRAALRVRNPTRNKVNWAYTASNLAETLNGSVAFSSYSDQLPRLEESVKLSRESAAYFIEAGDIEAGAQTEINASLALMNSVDIRRERRRRQYILDNDLDLRVIGETARSPSDDDLSFDPVQTTIAFARLAEVNPRAFGKSDTPEWATEINSLRHLAQDERAQLDEACARATSAHALDGSGAARSRASQLLGDAAVMYGDAVESAAAYFQRAYDELGDAFAPRAAAECAASAGEGWSMVGRWEDAATAYSDAISAIDEVYDSKSGELDRELELVRFPKIAEMAAFALAKVGRLEEAVIVLERGRARNLARRLLLSEPDLSRIGIECAELADLVASEIEGARRDISSSRARLDSLFSKVRNQTSLKHYGHYADSRDIAAASSLSCPLIYLVTTPAGSISMLVVPGAEELQVKLLASCEITSASLVTNLTTISIEEHRATGLQARDDVSLEAGLEQFSQDIGAFCGAPVVNYLQSIEADSVNFVAAGILSSAPISAAVVASDNRRSRLIDYAATALTPSASALLAMRRRRLRRGEACTFTGFGDAERSEPGRSLRWAEPELRRSAANYAESTVTVGGEVTSAEVFRASQRANVVHMACHGVAGQGNTWLSSLILADRMLPAVEIWESLRLDGNPVVVLSTCESAQYGIAWAESNEYIGLSGSFLAAGATDVICSLAEVNDYATSLLMSQFHFYLRRYRDFPDATARALRDAQLWFRESPISDLAILVREEGDSRGEIEEKQTRSLLSRIKRASDSTAATSRPLSHWAQFVLVN